MPMTREQRIALHKKQERTSISSGPPRSSDLKEGVSEVRNVHGLGVVEYTKVNGAVVENVYNRPPSKAIRDLTDSTGGTSGGNTVANFGAAPLNLAAAASVTDAENAVATIVDKLNAILNVLREHKLIEKFDKL
jgi:hypothetical protein|tara:strand:- start:888 stop:1289 length:402 start_codon:yes stop_codon:yes gene_type:complete